MAAVTISGGILVFMRFCTIFEMTINDSIERKYTMFTLSANALPDSYEWLLAQPNDRRLLFRRVRRCWRHRRHLRMVPIVKLAHDSVELVPTMAEHSKYCYESMHPMTANGNKWKTKKNKWEWKWVMSNWLRQNDEHTVCTDAGSLSQELYISST